jgi:putative ABC transport system substrate-binding protein
MQFDQLKRREFVALLGGAATAWPLAARAQQLTMPMVGVLHQGAPEANQEFIASFRQGLRQSGFVEGQNVKVEVRWAEGHYDRLPALAAELAHLNVAVMVAAYLPAALAAKSITTTVPIVFVSGSDPVEAGLVASFNRPSGNVTGIVITGTLGAKRLELLRQLSPKVDLVAVLANPTNRNTQVHVRDLQTAALTLARRRGGVAARGARAAAGVAGDWVPERAITPHMGSDAGRLSKRLERVGLRRRTKRSDRISMGGRTTGSTAGARDRSGSTSGRRDRCNWRH